MQRLADDLPAAARADIERALASLAVNDARTALGLIEGVARQLADPGMPSYLLGLLSVRVGEPGKALKGFTVAHEVAPDIREYAEALGILHAHLGHVVESLYFAKLATAATREVGLPGLLPEWLGGFAETFFHMREEPLLRDAAARLKAGAAEEAAELYRKAAEVDPESAPAWRGRAAALLAIGRPLEAVEAGYHLLALLSPEAADHALQGEALAAAGRFTEALAVHRSAVAMAPEDPAVGIAAIRSLARRPVPDDAVLAGAAASFAARFAMPFDRPARPTAAELAGRRLRLAVMSSRWRPGDGLDLVVPVIERLDRRLVELFVYADGGGESPLARVLKGRADHWHDIGDLDDDTLVFVMRNDEPDILIDLDGPCGCRRPVPCLSGPASLMLSLYGVAGAAGALGFDAVLAGPALPGDRHVLRVAGGVAALPLDLPPPLAPSDRAGLTVFGTLAPVGAISPATVALWAKVLRGVPRARLRLDADSLGGPSAATAILAALAPHVPHGTVGFGAAALSRMGYLAEIDLLLEPADNPYPDAAVAALGLGVPVLTLAGAQPRATLLNDMLARLGLADLVAASPDAFLDTAVEGAKEIIGLRQRLHARLPAEREHGAAKAAAALIECLADALLRPTPG